MVRAHRLSLTGALIFCLVGTQWNSTLFASGEELSSAISTNEIAAETPDVLPAAAPALEPSRFTLNAADLAANPSRGPIAQGALPFHIVPPTSSALAAQVYQGRPYVIGRDRSITAIMVGAVAAITGAAVLVYANRPDCNTDQFAGGCGYGTKVVGGAVLSGGLVSLFVGALTWR